MVPQRTPIQDDGRGDMTVVAEETRNDADRRGILSQQIRSLGELEHTLDVAGLNGLTHTVSPWVRIRLDRDGKQVIA